MDLRAQDRRLAAAGRKVAAAVPRAFFVGGFVRDALLGVRSKDADIEVYGVTPDALLSVLRRAFGEVETVGKTFGVMKVHGKGFNLDVSIPRRESKTGKGHRGFLVEADPTMSFADAARRRDFTVNAIMLDPKTGEIVDPFGGRADLKKRVLRVTDATTFQEDPLRVLRAVQLAARLGFSVEPKSLRLMRSMVKRGDLSELSRERVSGEVEKLLFRSRRPSVGLAIGARIGVWRALFPDCPVVGLDAWTRRVDAAVRKTPGSYPDILSAFVSGFRPSCRERAFKRLMFLKSDVRIALHGRRRKPLLLGRDLIESFGLQEGKRIGELIRRAETARDAGTVNTKKQAIAFVKKLLPVVSSVEL